MAHGQIGYMELHSKDLAETRSFYETIFGWTFTQDMGPEYLMFGDTGGHFGGGFSKDVPPATTGGTVYVTVDSIEKTLPQIAEAGGTPVQEKKLIDESVGWWASFKDPSGNLVGLYEMVQK